MTTSRSNVGASAEILPLEPVPNSVLGRLYHYWREQRGEAALPPFRSIRPEELRFMLGRITLIDVLDQPLRFRYRLVGTVVTTAGAIDMQGQLVSALRPRFYARLVESHLAGVFQRGEPALYAITVFRPGAVRSYQRIVLPYAADPDSGAAGALMTGTWHAGDLESVLGHPDFTNAEDDASAPPAAGATRPAPPG